MKKYDDNLIMCFAVYHRTMDLVKATGYSRATIDRYKKDSVLMRLAEERRKEIIETAVHKMEYELYSTINTLCKIRDNKGVNPQVRVSACNTILNHYHPLRESLEIDRRLDELEKRAKDAD